MKVDRSEKLAEAHDQLTDAIAGLVSSERWAAMLDVAGKFHSYSWRNVVMIMAQRPDVSRVAGYRAWQALGRQVRKGEQGIKILAPVVYKRDDDADGEPGGKVLRGFKIAHVFDIAQTDGDELPDVSPQLLEGDAPGALWADVSQLVETEGFRIERNEGGTANGSVALDTHTVRVRADLQPAQALKTIVHELAHIRLGHLSVTDYSAARGRYEVEAESVAHVVCAALGLDTADYSAAYVARWSAGDLDVIRDTAGRVIACAHQILTDLDSPTTAAAITEAA